MKGNPFLAALAMEGKSHWHFATHGFYDPGPHLAIRHCCSREVRDDDDAFHPTRISTTQKSLVSWVLSACETGGSGSFIDDTEFGGLPGAFISKGAAGVISFGAWPVG